MLTVPLVSHPLLFSSHSLLVVFCLYSPGLHLGHGLRLSLGAGSLSQVPMNYSQFVLTFALCLS